MGFHHRPHTPNHIVPYHLNIELLFRSDNLLRLHHSRLHSRRTVCLNELPTARGLLCANYHTVVGSSERRRTFTRRDASSTLLMFLSRLLPLLLRLVWVCIFCFK